MTDTDNFARVNFPPLTPLQKRRKNNLVDRFLEFWRNVNFTRGYSHPFTCKEDVSDHLKIAAEAVVRIRDVFISGDQSPPFRIPEGDALEFLWRETHSQPTPIDPIDFTKRIIYSTLQNDPELQQTGVSKPALENFISQFITWKAAHKKAPRDKLNKFIARLREAAARCNTVADLMERSKLHPIAVLGPDSCKVRDMSLQLKLLIQDFDSFVVHMEQQDVLHDSGVVNTAQILAPLKHGLRTPLEEPTSEPREHEMPKTLQSETPLTTETKPEASMDIDKRPSDIHNEVLVEPEPKTNPEKPEAVLASDVHQPAIEKAPEPTVTPAQTDTHVESPIQTDVPVSPSEPKVSEPAPKGELPEPKVETEIAEPTHPDVSMAETPTPVPTTPAEPSPTEVPPRTDTPSSAFLLEIKKVASNVDTLKPQITELRQNSDLLNLSELSRNPLEGVKQVEKLQKKSLEYSEYLMRDLLALDGLQSTEQTRPLRREQVISIQRLMNEMDGVSEKLRELRSQLEKEAEATKKKLEEERQQQQAQQPPTNKTPAENTATTAASLPPTAFKWAELKLKPKMNVREERNSYLIVSSIPGLKKEDISLSLTEDESTLVVEGVRVPTQEEIAQMEKFWASNRPRYNVMSKEAALMHIGAGRFGKFSERFSLPEDVDIKGISASYEGGVLKVAIPKIVRRRPAMSPFGFYPSNYELPGAGNLFGDRDMWW
ncbi:Heat shock protein Hsp20 [Pelomyxa schiedti]|nr:Heat shock protein Hsp20 [Pelomyxa schiedti]